jgi:Putative Na+/H+ antiporter
MSPSAVQMVGTGLFAAAVVHTFLTKHFERLAVAQPAHAGIWHLLGEVEAVFGAWALVFVLFLAAHSGTAAAATYVTGLNFTEPMFVFVVMVIAASRPILQLAQQLIIGMARLLPLPATAGFYLAALSLTPLLGSLITEPAAMTLSALMLRDHLFARGISRRLKYATLGVLFVNVSIGGTLTPYAAPPVLMVAATWGWDLPFMLSTFGWRAALAVTVNALLVTALFWPELKRLPPAAVAPRITVPPALIAVHLGFLAAVVAFAHHSEVFMGLFLFFLGIAQAYARHQDRLMLREALLVAFFLAGLVTLGGQQAWWLQSALEGLHPTALYFGATALTAVTDNAALTYLGSLVQGTDDAFKYALVAGAVTGGGLTVIANAPNPAGWAILRGQFDDGAISPLRLLVAALPPTGVAIAAFWWL